MEVVRKASKEIGFLQSGEASVKKIMTFKAEMTFIF